MPFRRKFETANWNQENLVEQPSKALSDLFFRPALKAKSVGEDQIVKLPLQNRVETFSCSVFVAETHFDIFRDAACLAENAGHSFHDPPDPGLLQRIMFLNEIGDDQAR